MMVIMPVPIILQVVIHYHKKLPGHGFTKNYFRDSSATPGGIYGSGINRGLLVKYSADPAGLSPGHYTCRMDYCQEVMLPCCLWAKSI